MKRNYYIRVADDAFSREVTTIEDGNEISRKTYTQERWLNVMAEWFMANCNWLGLYEGKNLWEDKDGDLRLRLPS